MWTWSVHFDAFYEQRHHQAADEPQAATDELLVITSEAKGVVMYQQDLRARSRLPRK